MIGRNLFKNLCDYYETYFLSNRQFNQTETNVIKGFEGKRGGGVRPSLVLTLPRLSIEIKEEEYRDKTSFEGEFRVITLRQKVFRVEKKIRRQVLNESFPQKPSLSSDKVIECILTFFILY